MKRSCAATEKLMSGSVRPLVVHLDLFSGIGGFALAARMVGGIETVGFCEKDPWARKVLTKNFPGVPICEDIHEVNGMKYGNIDIITGGFPCQPFSQSNTRSRKGVEDSRYLWPQMFRVIGEAGPSFVVAENSPDIEKFALEQVQSDLDSIGYDSIPVEIPAAGVGANHLRRRLWILAHARRVDAGKWRPRPAQREEAARLHWWDSYPGVHGVDDGLSRRVDGRKRMLGNAIVPHVAAEILRAMMHALSLHNVTVEQPPGNRNSDKPQT